MVKRLQRLILVLLVCVVSSVAQADEAALKKSLQSQFEGLKIESLKKTPYLGLYEIVVGGQLFYTDEKAKYFFIGEVVDIKTRSSLTRKRLQQIKDARRISLDSLPLKSAIKTVKGNGQRKVAIFTDPNCPYCKRLEKELVNVTDVTIYTLLYPILNGSEKVATSIWCADDRIKAWDNFMLNGVRPADKTCETPISTLLQSGRDNRVTGTPTLIFADGSVVGGMIPAAQIKERLNAANKK